MSSAGLTRLAYLLDVVAYPWPIIELSGIRFGADLADVWLVEQFQDFLSAGLGNDDPVTLKDK